MRRRYFAVILTVLAVGMLATAGAAVAGVSVGGTDDGALHIPSGRANDLHPEHATTTTSGDTATTPTTAPTTADPLTLSVVD